MAECLPATFVSLPEGKKNSSNNVVIQTKTFSVEEEKVNVRAFHLQCRISVVKTPPGRFLQPDSDKCFFFKQHKQPRVFELYWCVIFIDLFIF